MFDSKIFDTIILTTGLLAIVFGVISDKRFDIEEHIKLQEQRYYELDLKYNVKEI